MIKPGQIDKIDIDERGERLRQAEIRARDGVRAAGALGWFAEFTQRDDKPADTIKVSATQVASATPKAETAQYYLTRAGMHFRPQILDHAIKLAREDLDRADGDRG